MSVTLLAKLGSGNFGQVYKAKKSDGSVMAVKIIEPSRLNYIELDILTRLRSPYLIRSLKNPLVDTKLGMGINIELKENNLNNLNTSSLSYYQIKRIFMSCLYGLECMHKNNYLHIDISLKNIMYDVGEGGDITAFIGDFGYSMRCSDTKLGVNSDKVVRSIYITPENLTKFNNNEGNYLYNQSSDIWSLGIVFLILLGANFRKLTNKEDCKNHLENIKNIDEDYIEERIRLYNNNKMSSQEELELKELLVNMLKIDNKSRLNTQDINRLAFVKYQDFKNSCILEKLKEIYYLPYISPRVKHGINKIRERFQNDEKLNKARQSLEKYFLVIQNYIRLMSRSKPDLTEKDLDDIINTSLNIANNYYNRSDNGTFEVAKRLDGEMGYNPYFYKAQSIDDLVILHYYLIDNNDDLISFYNLIEPCEIFDIFRSLYEYTNVSKNKITVEDFFKITLPRKKIRYDVVAMPTNSYHNMLPDVEEKPSNIETIKAVEEDFRGIILDKINDKVVSLGEEDNDKINTIYDLLHGKITSNIYQDLMINLGELSICERLSDIFKYGYIKISSGRIEKTYKTDSEYVIIIDGNRSSLLHLKNKLVTHYYSDNNEMISNYYKEKDYEYQNNFKYGIGNCCVLREPCLIFNIYYNLKQNVEDFSTKCLEKNTFFVVLVLSIL